MIRFYLALFVAKLSKIAIRVLHAVIKKEGTNFPGIIALRICPDMTARVSKPKKIIAVTGTSGKTTTANIIADALESAGFDIATNRYGSNIITGITAALIDNVTIGNRVKKDMAVLEVDERSSLLVYKHVKPDYLVCANLSRDTLIRNAHPHFIFNVIQKALPEGTKLILNADDTISSGLKTGEQSIYYGIAKQEGDSIGCRNIMNDMRICPVCHAPLEYEYTKYNHFGRAHCTKCDFRSPDADYEVLSMNRDDMTMRVRMMGGGEHDFHMISDSIFNIYDEISVIALLSEMGIETNKIKEILSTVSIVETRLRINEAGGIKILSNMTKGQIAMTCSAVFDYVAKLPGRKEVILMLEDMEAHFGNSEIQAYTYDTDFEFLNDPDITHITVIGDRAKDFLFRMLLADIPVDKISTTRELDGLPECLELNDVDTVCILYDNTAHEMEKDVRAIVENAILGV